MSLNDRIREARKSKGLTQEQLGSIIGVAKTTIAGYEKNREPTAANVGAIADALGVDVNFLFQDEIKNSSDSVCTETEELRSDEKQLIEDYNKLNSAGQEDALEHIEFLLTKQKYLRPEYIKSDNSKELA